MQQLFSMKCYDARAQFVSIINRNEMNMCVYGFDSIRLLVQFDSAIVVTVSSVLINSYERRTQHFATYAWWYSSMCHFNCVCVFFLCLFRFFVLFFFIIITIMVATIYVYFVCFSFEYFIPIYLLFIQFDKERVRCNILEPDSKRWSIDCHKVSHRRIYFTHKHFMISYKKKKTRERSVYIFLQ